MTGTEEAYYDYFGAINSMGFSNAFIMDIGESTSELILVKNLPIIRIGGTIRNIDKLHQKKLLKDSYQRKKLKGLSKERVDIFVGSTAALITLIALHHFTKYTLKS